MPHIEPREFVPSHKVHRRLAEKYLGLPGHISVEVDKLIDLDILHDVGRRLPGKPPTYLDVIEGGTAEKLSRKKKEKTVKELLRKLLSDNVRASAFYFHHGLDILALREASAILLELNLNRVCCRIVRGTIQDLRHVWVRIKNYGIYSAPFEIFEKEIKKALHKSCIDSDLID